VLLETLNPAQSNPVAFHLKKFSEMKSVCLVSLKFISLLAALSLSNEYRMNASAFKELFPALFKSNQIKIYIAPYVREYSEALGGWITCSRRVGIDEFLHVF